MKTWSNVRGLVLLALPLACVWSSRPGLPVNAHEDVPAVDHATDAPPLSRDAPVEDSAPPPPFDVPSGSADAGAPLDGSSLDECRFVSLRDGAVVPDGAVVVDGGYFTNARGELCDPSPQRDAGIDGDGRGDGAFVERTDGAVGDAEAAEDVPLDMVFEGGRP